MGNGEGVFYGATKAGEFAAGGNLEDFWDGGLERRTRCRLIVNPCPAAFVQVNPLVRETQTIAPIRLLVP